MLDAATQNIGARFGHGSCLLCGQHNPMSLKLNFSVGSDKTVEARFQSHCGLQGYDDYLHGGVISALLDCAMSHCLFHHNVQAVTVELTVRFVHSIPCTALLDLRAWIVSCQMGVLYHTKGEVRSGGKVMAWAEAKFMKQKSIGG